MSSVLLWSLLGYLCGSIPFSVLIGRYIVKIDPRTVGDGNPGGTNVWIAGGWQVGLLTMVFEIGKGWLPVWLARHNGMADGALVPVCLAPILGHATMPWLNWRGGKALGASGGVWLELLGWWVFPIYAAGALPVLFVQVEHAYAALAGMFALVIYAVFFDRSGWMTALVLLNTMLLLWTHRGNLGRPLQWRGWVTNLFPWRSA